MKILTISFLFILLLCCSCFSSLWAQSNPYAVEVGAFDQKVALDYFSKMENTTVYEVVDVNDIYRYWIDSKDKKSAGALRKKAINKGFINARVIDFAILKEHCKASCGYTPPKATGRNGIRNFTLPTDAEFEKNNPSKNADIGSTRFFDLNKEQIECIFFDYDRADLRSKSKEELDKVASVLLQKKSYKVKLYAHTDANGSNSYNDRLSEARAQMAHQYLVWRGVADGQIVNGPFGEQRPIACNALKNGADTPEGRQLNRRVELAIFDENGKDLGIVKDIEVPTQLQLK